MQPQALAVGVQRIDVGPMQHGLTHLHRRCRRTALSSCILAVFAHRRRGFEAASDLAATLAGTDLTGRDEYLPGTYFGRYWLHLSPAVASKPQGRHPASTFPPRPTAVQYSTTASDIS